MYDYLQYYYICDVHFELSEHIEFYLYVPDHLSDILLFRCCASLILSNKASFFILTSIFNEPGVNMWNIDTFLGLSIKPIYCWVLWMFFYLHSASRSLTCIICYFILQRMYELVKAITIHWVVPCLLLEVKIYLYITYYVRMYN